MRQYRYSKSLPFLLSFSTPIITVYALLIGFRGAFIVLRNKCLRARRRCETLFGTVCASSCVTALSQFCSGPSVILLQSFQGALVAALLLSRVYRHPRTRPAERVPPARLPSWPSVSASALSLVCCVLYHFRPPSDQSKIADERCDRCAETYPNTIT